MPFFLSLEPAHMAFEHRGAHADTDTDTLSHFLLFLSLLPFLYLLYCVIAMLFYVVDI